MLAYLTEPYPNLWRISCQMRVQPHNQLTVPQPEQWQTEATVNIAKNRLNKVTQDNQERSQAMLAWCNTPSGETHYYNSWVQKLEQRRMHTQLPTADELLKPEISKGIENEIHSRRQKAKQQFERTAKNFHFWQQDKLPKFSQISARDDGWRVQS